MNNYSDLQVTDLILNVEIIKIGNPDYLVTVNNRVVSNNLLNLPLLNPIIIDVELKNKIYTIEYETAVIVTISIDKINLIPQYNHLIKYQNDHNNNNPTNYLGFNGKWTLTIDRPFYQWLHHVQGQGWLLT